MIKIQKEDFNSDEEIHNIKKKYSNIGAVTSFIGYVRDNNNDQNVKSINLEVYEGMAHKQLKKIINDARKYNTKKNWYETSKSSYDAAKSQGLLKNKKVIGHFEKTIYPVKWTLKRIITDVKKYNTRKEWRENSGKDKAGNSYSAAVEKKLSKDERRPQWQMTSMEITYFLTLEAPFW